MAWFIFSHSLNATNAILDGEGLLVASGSNPKFLMTQALSFFPATALLLGHVATAMLPPNAL